jgi:hypothetical protein
VVTDPFPAGGRLAVRAQRRANLASRFFLLFALLPACASVLRATRDDDRATLARLLAAGEAPDTDDEEMTPLFEAIEQGNMPVARLLVEAGANVNRWSTCGEWNVTPLHKAILHNRPRMVRYLLAKGADATQLAHGHDVFSLIARTPAMSNSREIMDAILDHVKETAGDKGVLVFVNRSTPNGWTPLALAAWWGNVTLLDALLARGAAVDALAAASNVDRQGPSSDRWSPLHFARIREQHGIVARLRAAGADPEQRSLQGLTPDEVVSALAEERARQAELEERLARLDREESARSWATFQGAMAGLQNGYQQASSSDNPVNDDSFQDEMKELANRSASQNASGEVEAEPNSEYSEADEGQGVSAPSADGSSVAIGLDPSRPSPADGDGAAREEQVRATTEADARKKAGEDEAERARAAKEAQEAKAELERKTREEAARNAAAAYLSAMREGILLRATKCPDGEGHYYVTGTKPNLAGGCIDVIYRASCPGGVHVSTGIARNFVGQSGCFGDTYQIGPKLPCPVDQVSVSVSDVQYGCD